MLGDAPTYRSYNKYDGQGLGAKAIAIKIFDNAGSWAAGSDYFGFWQEAYTAGARVNSNRRGSNSGGAYGPSDSDADRVTRTYRYHVLAITAGNADASGVRTVGSPASAKNAITVGALLTNTPEDVASFSSRGPTRDSRIKPDVMAPGAYIRSTRRGTVTDYTDMQGTSREPRWRRRWSPARRCWSVTTSSVGSIRPGRQSPTTGLTRARRWSRRS